VPSALRRWAGGLALLGTLAACAGHPAEPLSAEPDETAFRGHIQTLSSDEFEGRRPGTPGEEKTVAYLVDQLKKLGLKPGNGSSYVQPVPLMEITAGPDTSVSVSGRGKSLAFVYGKEAVIWTKRPQAAVHLADSQVVFAGYGIVAPEYSWDDYAGLDARGKTVVVLVNDPGFATGDPRLFQGRTMTYYGRWTYKYEEAARHGAAAALIVHDSDAAGYGWNVVQGGWTGPQQDLVPADGNARRPLVEGWLSGDAARALFAQAGLGFDETIASAARRGFKPVVMGLRAEASIHNQVSYLSSQNVIALLPGAQRAKEYIFYTAHWDHFGTSVGPEGTRIYHGAADNASGVAAMLTIAQSFSRLPVRPGRSIVFLFPTAEESGLLGSAYYVAHPIYPLKDTVAALNFDNMRVGGPTRDVTVYGLGNSELDDYLRAAALLQGRELTPDPEPEKGQFFRSDHFNFAKAGVPSVQVVAGFDDAEHGPKWGRAQEEDFIAHRYHEPADVYLDSWDLRGAMQDLSLYLGVGMHLARDRRFPNWYRDSEFGPIRDKVRPPERRLPAAGSNQ
jgi:Zn-dependent M28 family amino/carboxypeptidase